MSTVISPERARTRMLLGDEAVAIAALDAGITGAYAYPGTPSTEMLEFLMKLEGPDQPTVSWCANEKTAYEQALGVSMAGRRALVGMKHVGLNVAADPFINSAIVSPVGGLVVAVADDPSMHSSQNEQDSRFYADFARIPCMEPADPQQAYDMTREAFQISERFHVPVMIRLVTRLAHERAAVTRRDPLRQKPINVADDRSEWVLLPAFSRRQWKQLIEQQPEHRAWAEASGHNVLNLVEENRSLGVITTGIAREYFLDVTPELAEPVSHLHIGAYPIPATMIRKLARHVDTVLVAEDGYPYVERLMRGLLETKVQIQGRMTEEIPEDGELSTDVLRGALGLQEVPPRAAAELELPGRPPRLCDGCAHGEAFTALSNALAPYERPLMAADIGCYTLGALPPYGMADSCVCMGASIGMAKGASDAGVHPVVAIIGDSTFLHSGVTPLIDAVAADSNMTVLLLDNQVVAMTGGQETLLPSGRLHEVALGIGVPEEHCIQFESHPRKVAELEEILRREIEHDGLSVVIAHRECIEAARKRKAQERRNQS
jgi:indolepyruvate ferredoxin oxidoreductase alpha subunit